MVDLKKISVILGFFLLLTACQTQPATPVPTASPIPATARPSTATSTVVPQAILDPDTEASIRFVIAIPDAPRVDIYVGDSNAAQQLPPNSVSASLARPAGEYDVLVMPSGKAPDPTTALLSTKINVDAHEVVLCVVTGTTSRFGLTRLTENVDPVRVGQARVQFVDALDGSTALNILNDDQKVDTLQSAGQTTDSIPTTSGRHTFKFLGGDKADQTLLEQPFQLLDRQAYTMILVGPAQGPAKLVIAPSPTTRQSQIRVINASPNLGPVDVYLGTRLVGKAIDYRKPTEWELLPAFGFELKVFKAGSSLDSTPVFKDQVTLNPDQSGDIVVYDNAGLARLFWENMRPTSASGTRLTVLNAAQGTSTIQALASRAPIVGVPPIKYGDITAGTTIPVDSYLFSFVTLNEDPARTIEAAANPVDLREGVAYLYIVTGEGVNNVPFLLSTDVGTLKSPVVPTATPTPLPTGVMQVRVVNATEDQGAIDILANGTPLFHSVVRGSASPVIQLTSADIPVILTQVGSTTKIAGVQLAFMPGRPMMLLAVGGRVGPVELFEVPDDMQVNSDVALVQVADISAVTPQISIEATLTVNATSSAPNVGPSPTPRQSPNIILVDQITRGHVSSTIPVSSGDYTFVARSNLDGPILFFATRTLQLGKRYLVVILPDSGVGQMSVVEVDR